MAESVFGEDSPFEKCEDCGSVYVTWSSHDCTTNVRISTDTRAGRDTLSAMDDGDPEDTVVVAPGKADTAYHEPADGEDLAPACGAELLVPRDFVGRDRAWVDTDRETARDRRGYYPCRRCYDLDGV